MATYDATDSGAGRAVTGPRSSGRWHARVTDFLGAVPGRRGQIPAPRRQITAPPCPRQATGPDSHLVIALETALAGLRHRAPHSPQRYEIAEVLAPLVLIGRSDADKVAWAVPDYLYTYGKPDTLAQVLLHLLTNCARHAPGAPVTVAAAIVDGWIQVSVTNKVPQVATDGGGMGLKICARMVVAEGGRMRVVPADPSTAGAPGWRVIIELPARP